MDAVLTITAVVKQKNHTILVY